MNGNLLKWLQLLGAAGSVGILISVGIWVGTVSADQKSHENLPAHPQAMKKFSVIGKLDERSKAVREQVKEIKIEQRDQRRLLLRILEKVSK